MAPVSSDPVRRWAYRRVRCLDPQSDGPDPLVRRLDLTQRVKVRLVTASTDPLAGVVRFHAPGESPLDVGVGKFAWPSTGRHPHNGVVLV